MALAERWQVEATVIGTFTDDDRLTVTYGDVSVVDLPMAFVHDGCPRRQMHAVWTEPLLEDTAPPGPRRWN